MYEGFNLLHTNKYLLTTQIMTSIAICSKILSTIASPALTMAYEKGVSIWEAKHELSKLKVTIETIQVMLNDAENKQEGSDAVKHWIKRLKEVLYDAEDFFDEVLTEDLLKQQMKGKNNKLSLKNKVRVSCSMLNPIVSRNSIAKKVKTIRGRLAEISTDMAPLGFVQSHPNKPMVSMGREKYNARCFIGEKSVIGRDEDKNAILEMLISDGPVVIAIDGIGGMGKTTLAHLIYNDINIKMNFDKRWFACISETSSEIEVLKKIYQPMCEGGTYNNLSEIQLVDKITESIEDKKYLLVLDDVWEDHRGRWDNRKSLLSSGAKGSKIIVTTRLQSVVRAMGAVRARSLKGLSEDDSWKLFERLAFDSPYENDPRRENVGRKLLKRCRGVPLAIWCMGSLLHNKTIQEWEEIERVGLPTVRGVYNDEVMSILKLSYDHLPPNLKRCFTYCCLFPKDYIYMKKELIHHWIAQGYINLDEEESSFMHLLRMGFFQKVQEDMFGGIWRCKMHDIMHDLALHLSGEESIVMSGTTSLNVSSCTRYVSLMVDGEEGGLWDIPTPLLSVKSMRSCTLISSSYGHIQPNLDQLCLNFKLLRTLTLSDLGVEHIPPSIGELKLVRYLDLSCNKFEELPDSIANLVNLLTLKLYHCSNLKVWPRSFKKLNNLRSLDFRECYKLRLMPEGIGVMDNLRYLSDFRVGKESELDVLNGFLKQLRGGLYIRFHGEMAVEGEWRWQLPASVSLQRLDISDYPGQRIQGWGDNESTSKLESLKLISCKNVKHLTPLSCLPILKHLELRNLYNLEFMEEEEEEEVNAHYIAAPNSLFFSSLEKLVLCELPKLKRWRGRVAAEATSTSSTSTASLEFSHLSKLHVRSCPNLELNSVPLCPQLQELLLGNVGDNTSTKLKQELSSTILCPSTYQSLKEISIQGCKWLSSVPGEALVSLRKLVIDGCCRLKSLQLASPHLLDIELKDCDELTVIELCERQSLRSLRISGCKQMKSFHIDEQQGLRKAETRILMFGNMDGVLVERLLSALSMSSIQEMRISKCKGPIRLPGLQLTSLRVCEISETDGLESLHITSPHLQHVSLFRCVGLTRVEVEAPTDIRISCCSELMNFSIAHPNTLVTVAIFYPSSAGFNINLGDGRCIAKLELGGVDGVFMERLLSSLKGISLLNSIGSLAVALPSLRLFRISDYRGLKNLNFKSQHLERISIYNCGDLTSVEVESTFLASSFLPSVFSIGRCSQLNNVRIARPFAVKRLVIYECPELSLSTGVDWDSLTNLDCLELRPLPPLEELQLQLPQRLLQRHTLRRLQIEEASLYYF